MDLFQATLFLELFKTYEVTLTFTWRYLESELKVHALFTDHYRVYGNFFSPFFFVFALESLCGNTCYVTMTLTKHDNKNDELKFFEGLVSSS